MIINNLYSLYNSSNLEYKNISLFDYNTILDNKVQAINVNFIDYWNHRDKYLKWNEKDKESIYEELENDY